MSEPDRAASFVHAAEYLKTHDRDRYFASLLVSGEARNALQALYAFNADVASVRERAKEPTMGEIRLQWWVDALSGEGHGAVRQNPLADALLGAIASFNLPSAPLLRLIDARRFDLYHDPMPDLATFEGYAGETVSVLYQLAAMILNKGEPVETGDAAGHLGVAHALIGHVAAFGFNAAQGRIFLPWSVLAANGVSEREVFSGTVSEGLLAARGQLQDMAREHLDKADAAIVALPRQLHRAFSFTALLRSQLAQIESAERQPFGPPPELADWRKIALLTWWSWRNG
ncbi:MAG: squalene/phytoene synthase family protein [Hyphomicrobiales bacterium]|nr:squalene/phytoene synthase family protein [Hyphomicrobiales bacterium]